jgi:hypothetical protein
MADKTLKASCLCGAVKFELTPPFGGFRYCHCSRCRKATGAAHAANIFLPQSQLKWLAGEERVKTYRVPNTARFTVRFCTECGTRVPHKIPGTENYMVPAGLLDDVPAARPDMSIFWGSRAQWFVETPALPKHEEYQKP